MQRSFWFMCATFGVLTVAACLAEDGELWSAQEKGKAIPTSLMEVEKLGEHSYDEVKSQLWDKAGSTFISLQTAAKKLPDDVKLSDADKKRLDTELTNLEKALNAKNRAAGMRAANQITLIGADLVEPFGPNVPADVTRLDHYGRELEIWVEAKDLGKLKSTTSAIRKCWDKLQPAVKARSGEAEAKRFSALVAQAERAKTVEDFGKVFTPILDEVDNLEGVFKKAKN